VSLHKTAYGINLGQMNVFLWYSFQHLHRLDNRSGWINIPPGSKYFLSAQCNLLEPFSFLFHTKDAVNHHDWYLGQEATFFSELPLLFYFLCLKNPFWFRNKLNTIKIVCFLKGTLSKKAKHHPTLKDFGRKFCFAHGQI